jgi:hypothetical protein
MQDTSTLYWIAILINSAFLFVSLKLAFSTNLIKDDSIQLNKPYSYARAQLFWWTIIIISVFIWCAVFNQGVPQLTPLCLALLGISAGTTAAGTLIDSADKNTTNVQRHQDANECSSFFKDILSDKDGNYSIHRFQSLIFNIAIGIIFLWKFFSSDLKTVPSFDNSNYILGLLGISNLGYAGMKISENSTRKDMVSTLKNQGNTDEQVRTTMLN